MTGQADGNLDLSLAFNPDLVGQQGIARENINIQSDFAISNLQVRDYLVGNGIRDGALNITIGDQGLAGSGTVNLDGINSAVEVSQSFAEDAVLRVVAKASEIPSQKVQQFIPGLESVLSGTSQGQFEYVATANQRATLNVDMDLTTVGVDFPALVYEKSAGQQGRVQFDVLFDDQTPIAVRDIRLTGPDLRADAQLDLTSESWSQMDISSVQISNTQLRNLQIQNLADRFRIIINGGILDLRPFLDQFTERSGNQDQGPQSNDALGFSLVKPVVITETRLDQMLFEPGAHLDDVGLAMIIADDGLRGMGLNATSPDINGTGSGKVTARVQGQEGAYTLQVTADNFGAFTQSLGMSEDIRDGSLIVQGNSAHPLGGGAWNLSANATDFRLLDTPALVQVTSGISLTGIVEQLTGSGLRISDLEFRGTLASPTVHIQRLKLDGPSLGLSMAGALNWQRRIMNIRGALSIFNILNMAVQDIPILREVLTGVDGQGLIATQFQVGGDFDQINVQVDPLSTIQPGLLRSVIDEIEGEEY